MEPEDNSARQQDLATNESGPGTGVLDFIPIPHTTQPVSDPHKEEVANSLAEKPTLSHALAMDDHEEKGIVQQEHREEDVANLGWNETKQHIAAPLVGGIDNESLWLLLRRFNKVRIPSVL
jgi:hypothetical protein